MTTITKTRGKKRRKPKPPNKPTWALLRVIIALSLLAWRYYFNYLDDTQYYLAFIGVSFIDYLYVRENYKTSILDGKRTIVLFLLALMSYFVYPIVSAIDLIRAWKYWAGI